MMIAAAPPELIDIGANLTHASFTDDLPQVLHRADAAGVRRMIVTGTGVAETRAALALHAAHPARLFATCGLHPHHASELKPDTLAELQTLAQSTAVVAVGECGLDYYRNFSPRQAQLAAFRSLLELAVSCRKPVFLHQRDAHEDFVAILREFRGALVDGVAHCFTGQARELEDYLELKLAIGITGWICDERRGIETDAPYLMPRSLQPKPRTRRNEPAYLPEVARVVAQARGESLESLAASTTAAANRFFKLA
jgi:TatD DNase family protein